MESVQDRRTADGCAWTVAWALTALVLATAVILVGNSWVIEAWHWCLSQDHEPDPDMAAAVRSVWAVSLALLLLLGAVLSRLPGSRWYLLPAMLAVAAALTWLFVIGMGSPAPLQPGAPEETPCWSMRSFPFLD
ncbi:hypothetical protein KCMC57_up36230 [Kitasatospora sp. CMC57]|uniref:Uncharacterized protein n=1 Tax=Kitasatospora sp. CMC57 TaxID=3231513 RepID=A0AB33K0J6_9ACTN